MVGGGFAAAKKRPQRSSFNHLDLTIDLGRARIFDLAIVKIVSAAWCPGGEAA